MHIEHLMELYDEAVDELMGAQEYAKKSDHASDAELKSMYKTMARQELEHENLLVKAGQRMLASEPPESLLHAMWKHLTGHLNDWRGDIDRRLM